MSNETNIVIRENTPLQAVIIPERLSPQQCVYTDDNDIVHKGEYYELSVYGNKPASYEEISTECGTKLMLAFPAQEKTFFPILYETIQEEGMSILRLREAIKHVISTNKYRTFSIADIVGYDKTFKVAKNLCSLRQATKNNQLQIKDTVVVRWVIDGNECRMLGVRYDIENSVFKSQIIGVWDDKENWWKILGQINDKTLPDRREKFKTELYEYCNLPPKYNGKYEVKVIKSFYDYYSQKVNFGDEMLFETFMSFDIESAIRNWNNKHFSKTTNK